jgi:hypothetical protein
MSILISCFFFCHSHIYHTAAYLAKIFSVCLSSLSEVKLTIYRFI